MGLKVVRLKSPVRRLCREEMEGVRTRVVAVEI